VVEVLKSVMVEEDLDDRWRGSLEELRYFLLLSKDLNYISKEEYDNFEKKLTEISYLLNQLIKSLTSTPSATSKTSTTLEDPCNPKS